WALLHLLQKRAEPTRLALHCGAGRDRARALRADHRVRRGGPGGSGTAVQGTAPDDHDRREPGPRVAGVPAEDVRFRLDLRGLPRAGGGDRGVPAVRRSPGARATAALTHDHAAHQGGWFCTPVNNGADGPAVTRPWTFVTRCGAKTAP